MISRVSYFSFYYTVVRQLDFEKMNHSFEQEGEQGDLLRLLNESLFTEIN